MGFAPGVDARRDNTDRLAFEHRERHGAEVEHDVMRIVFAPDLGHAHVTHHFRGNMRLRRRGAVKVGIGMRRRPRRQDRIVALVAETFAADRLERH